jgi:DUF1680 family protein
VALERGPLVHCLEQVDQPGVPGLDDIVLDLATELTVQHRPDLLGGVTTVVGSGRLRPRPAGQGWWPYRATRDTERDNTAQARKGVDTLTDTPVELTAIPYYAWANREDGSMRVWLPTS